MMLLEHEGKALLGSVGVPIPQGTLITAQASIEPTVTGASLTYPVAVKAQVAGGGRGKAGGVVRADNARDAIAAAARLFATRFGDLAPRAVLLDPWVALDREVYLSVTVDGAAEGYVVLYAPKGGIDIEDGPPPARYPVGAPWRFRAHELRAILQAVEADYQLRERVITIAQRLVETAAAHDCTTIEINPLARLSSGDVIALDAKVVYDEWAHYRSAAIAAERHAEWQRADPLLRACLEMQHMYVALDGDIGLISGGAGMTMAAMDLILRMGGKPACFLDCSPGPTSTRGYRPAFALLDGDPRVKAILVSVFGGGTQMQRVARAMKENMAMRTSDKPVVFRLDGTNVDQVPEIFAAFGGHNHGCLEDAVRDVIEKASAA
jgi:succinyl-CoA synthetase beta subunit